MSAKRRFLALLGLLIKYIRKAIKFVTIWTRRFLKWWAEKTPGFFYSFWLHVLILLFLIGAPLSCRKEPTQQSVVTVELLPVKDVTNVKQKEVGKKPREKPKVKEKKKLKPKKKEAKVAPPPRPKPKPKVIPAPRPKAKPKPNVKPKPKPKPKEELIDFNTVLKSVEKIKEKKKDEKLNFPNNLDYEPSRPLSLSEIDAIKRQISKCWSIPAGARDAMDMSVGLYIALRRDGSLTKVDIVDKARYSDASDPFFRAAADAAVRAVRQCSPLKGLPPQKYNSWKEIELNFDPKEMLY